MHMQLQIIQQIFCAIEAKFGYYNKITEIMALFFKKQ